MQCVLAGLSAMCTDLNLFRWETARPLIFSLFLFSSFLYTHSLSLYLCTHVYLLSHYFVAWIKSLLCPSPISPLNWAYRRFLSAQHKILSKMQQIRIKNKPNVSYLLEIVKHHRHRLNAQAYSPHYLQLYCVQWIAFVMVWMKKLWKINTIATNKLHEKMRAPCIVIHSFAALVFFIFYDQFKIFHWFQNI